MNGQRNRPRVSGAEGRGGGAMVLLDGMETVTLGMVAYCSIFRNCATAVL
jgi:hypothetical protein